MTSATAPRPVRSGAVRDAGLAPAQLEQFEALLEEKRSTLLARVTRIGIDIEALQTPTATHGHGETEHASSSNERSVAEMLEAGTSEALEEIAFALARVDDGSYGICTSCGVPISANRLLAIPETRHCMSCRQGQERGGPWSRGDGDG
jgi:DnaK suppressor protein